MRITRIGSYRTKKWNSGFTSTYNKILILNNTNLVCVSYSEGIVSTAPIDIRGKNGMLISLRIWP